MKLLTILIVAGGVLIGILWLGGGAPGAPRVPVIDGGLYTVLSNRDDYPYTLLKVLAQKNGRLYTRFYRVSFAARPGTVDLSALPPGAQYSAMREDYFQRLKPVLLSQSPVDPGELLPIAKSMEAQNP